MEPDENIFKVTKEHEASFSFESEALELEGFYRFDGCFNYSAKDGEHNHMIHCCNINDMIKFLALLKDAANERLFDTKD